MGIPSSTAGPQACRPEDIGRRADERKPSFLAQARKRRAPSDERSDLLLVGGARFKARSEATQWQIERWAAKEAISEVPIPLPYALNLIYDTTRWYHKLSLATGHEIGWYLKGCPNLGLPFVVKLFE